LYCIIRGLNDKSIVESASIVYTGPATQLVETSIAGTGSGKFNVVSPGTPWQFKEGTDGTLVQVQFEVDQADLNRYEAILTISTDNGTVANILLAGQRQNF